MKQNVSSSQHAHVETLVHKIISDIMIYYLTYLQNCIQIMSHSHKSHGFFAYNENNGTIALYFPITQEVKFVIHIKNYWKYFRKYLGLYNVFWWNILIFFWKADNYLKMQVKTIHLNRC